jgi:hypothetical protein
MLLTLVCARHTAALGIMADEEEKKPETEAINLKVVTQDGNEIFFKCKMTTPLNKLMNAFCTRQGIAMNSVRFLFDGQRLTPNTTPKEVRSSGCALILLRHLGVSRMQAAARCASIFVAHSTCLVTDGDGGW